MEYYTVEPDDTLSSIASKFNLTESELATLNNLQSLPEPGNRLLIRSSDLSLTNEVYYFTRLGKVRGTLTTTEHVIVFDPLHQNNFCEILTDKGTTQGEASVFQAFIDLSDVIHCNIMELQGSMSSRLSDTMFIIELMLSRTGREKRGKRSDIPKVNVYFKLVNLLSNGESLQYLELKTKSDQILALVLSSLAQVDRTRADSGTYVPYYEVNKGYVGRVCSGLADEEDDEEFLECVKEMMDGQEREQENFVKPDMKDASLIMKDRMVAQIHLLLPNILQLRSWKLVYSTYLHGRSLSTLYLKSERIGPNILIVKDSGGFVFGGYFSTSWKIYHQSYGTGECFLFTFRDTERAKVFYSALSNDIYMASSSESLIAGGGGNAAILLDKYLETGSSGRSKTYNNQVLSSEPGFLILEVELWALV